MDMAPARATDKPPILGCLLVAFLKFFLIIRRCSPRCRAAPAFLQEQAVFSNCAACTGKKTDTPALSFLVLPKLTNRLLSRPAHGKPAGLPLRLSCQADYQFIRAAF